MENKLTKLIKRIDYRCTDLITVPYTYHEVGHNSFLTPNKKIELVLKKRGYYLVHPKSRRILFDTVINPLSFTEIQAQITNLTKRKVKNERIFNVD